ncbi:MAG: glutaredoxin domain-containing protein [Dehalococcoidia bacterium]
MADLVIYTVPGCNTCARAVQEMTDEGIEFEERDIHKNAQWLEEASRLAVTVPILVRGNRIEVGWRGDSGCLFQ